MVTTLIGASFLKTFCAWIGLKSEVGDANLHESRASNLSKSLIEESDYKPIQFGIDSGSEGQA
jgi:hypothetical protein